jgi:Invasin, domain 3
VLWLPLAAALAIALSIYLIPVGARAAGPAETVTVTLSPSTVVADGISTSTATATLSIGPVLVPGQAVAFASSDSGIHFAPTVANLDGTYTARLTSSTAAGTPTITATSRWAGRPASGESTLTQTPGPAKRMVLSLQPSSIIADGRSLTTATVTVADAYGNPVRTDAVVFTSSDPREAVTQVANNGNGTYSALVRSSKTPGQVAIQATDAAAGLSVRSELSQVAAASMLSLVTMQWTFDYTHAYTQVLSLVVNGAPAGATVLIDCHGRSCPFSRRLTVIKTRRCAPDATSRCAAPGTIDLARDFRRHLKAGTRITVAITQPQSIGKYYVFGVRAGRAPRVQVGCLAIGATRPGQPC